MEKTKNTKSNTNKSNNYLKSLQTLLDGGVITQIEFDTFKNRIETNSFVEKPNDRFEGVKKIKASDSNKVVLDVINLTKQYSKQPKPAINNLNFQLKEGQFHVFVGANGAGKTTTIKALVGAYAKWDGQILINGKENTKTISKQNIGYIPEKSLFPKNMTTKQYLISMAMMSGIKKADAIKFANDKLAELNMQNMANKNPNSFSSGQQKKILLAQALVHNPQILIMDEPAANLDPIARVEFYTIVQKLQSEGKTIFLSSHILAEVGKYANYVTILDGGKIVYSDEVKEGEDLEKLYFSYVKEGSVDTGVNQKFVNNNQTNLPTENANETKSQSPIY